MAASGLAKCSSDKDGFKGATESKDGHIVTMAKFAFEIQKKLDTINKHSFNEFKLRIGKLSDWSKDVLTKLIFRSKSWSYCGGSYRSCEATL